MTTEQGAGGEGVVQPDTHCPPPDPHPRRPHVAVPDFACDCHAHVIGPSSRYPFVAERSYTPPDALLTDYLKVARTLGLKRSVIVQPSMHGTGNSAILDAIESAGPDGPEFRAVAVVAPETTAAEYLELHRRGVRGLRLNTVYLGGRSALDQAQHFAARIGDLGWHLEILCDVSTAGPAISGLDGLGVPIVFDHFGHLDARKGASDPGFRRLLDMVRAGNTWVKISGAYRLTHEDFPYDDVRPFAEALLALAPERLLWGTDWPHTVCRVPMPNDGELLDLLASWVGDETMLRRVLVDNPAQFYGFENATTSAIRAAGSAAPAA
jgi:predicted TIM-barrel fold metal-dependent hydrolase